MKKSLKVKMLVTFSLIVLISCVVIAFVSYSASVKLVKNSLSNMAGNIIQSAENLIDIQKYEQITLDSGETDYYFELREQLNTLRETTGLEYLYTMNRKEINGNYEYFYVVDGMPVDEDDASAIGDKEDVSLALEKAFDKATMQVEMTNDKDWGALVTAYMPIKSTTGEVIGIIGADLDATEVYKTMSKDRTVLMIFTLLTLLISLVVIYYFTSSLLKPLISLTQKVQKVGEGDLSTEIHIKRSDEIGTLAVAINKMQHNLRDLISNISRATESISHQGEELTLSSNKVKQDSLQVAATMQELACGADAQSQKSSNLSQTMKEFHHHIIQAHKEGQSIGESSAIVMDMTNKGSKHMNDSVQQMETINRIMNHSVEKVKGLDRKAQEITQLVDVIKGIAEQTNLLALNAAIEAARAGEHGKGFSVVANEVRKLAEQVSGSVQNITTIVTNIQEEANGMFQSLENGYQQIKEGTNQIKITGETFVEIEHSFSTMVTSISSISQSFNTINNKTNHILSSIEEVASISEESAAGVEQTSQSVQQTTGAMEEISCNVHSLFTLAEQLNKMIGKFKLS